jgi:hypothetical protein
MAMKDYNSINFKNSAIDRLTSKFGDDNPVSRKEKRLMNKAGKQIKSALEEAQSLRPKTGVDAIREAGKKSKKS